MNIGYDPRAPTPGHVDDVWYLESAPKLTRELPGPRIVAIEHAEQSREQDAPAGAGAHRRGGDAMERVIERCCGLDVHKKTVVACVRVPGRTSAREQQVRTFGTTTAELLALRDWLAGYGVTHVAMESTGVYWKPIFYVLEDAFTCVLANAAQIAQVPGRKTDVKDCAWIAQLLEHGLLRGSFVPPVPIRELRDLTRYRKALIQDRTRVANRLHKATSRTAYSLDILPQPTGSVVKHTASDLDTRAGGRAAGAAAALAERVLAFGHGATQMRTPNPFERTSAAAAPAARPPARLLLEGLDVDAGRAGRVRHVAAHRRGDRHRVLLHLPGLRLGHFRL